ncbi:hypothetical protein OCU04_000896 [Sclerotinia nivalis]|uniref:Uncharacterized protein n=1 Tax=Sclerotinia nivalis TaxID=352851 RepID=A0A9X0AX20_9HELO|nr:hypothetical protein OCU04_000896 [Sclerotinia nivalis]
MAFEALNLRLQELEQTLSSKDEEAKTEIKKSHISPKDIEFIAMSVAPEWPTTYNENLSLKDETESLRKVVENLESERKKSEGFHGFFDNEGRRIWRA